ncbi:MAG TPA: hypothetical protein VMV69_19945 [Pirellulales bacterium]|nr:hypothetical protein [Pirellulales bacterium]
MSTETKETIVIDPQSLADCEAVLRHVLRKEPLDPEIARRVHRRAARITEEIQRKHGILEIGIPAIREFRDRQ